MIDVWVIQASDQYYHKKNTLGTFCKDIENAKEYPDKKSARRAILLRDFII